MTWRPYPELNDLLKVNASPNQWSNLIDEIPRDLKESLVRGPKPPTENASWAATELDHEPYYGDIYKIIADSHSVKNLEWHHLDDDTRMLTLIERAGPHAMG